MYKALSILLLLASVTTLANNDLIRQQADSAYLRKEFAQAAELYNQILASGSTSAEVLYNLGNSYFRLGDIPLAILNYERALRLAPSDDDIIMNLRLANLQVKDKIEVLPEVLPVRIWNYLMDLLSMDQWAWASVFALILVVCGALIYFISPTPTWKMTGFFSGLTFVLILTVCVAGAWHQHKILLNDDRAVITAPTLNAHAAPDATSGLLFVVHEGTVVQVTQEMGGWFRIKLKDGNVGWVPQGVFERI